MAVSVDGTPVAAIEVGASSDDGTLRYWLAKEAVAKGETLLGSQSSSLGRLSANAVSMMGWSVTISLALTAAIASALLPINSTLAHTETLLNHLLWPTIVAEGLMLAASICCFVIIWPGKWHVAEFEPELVLGTSYGTELEVLEAMAGGCAIALADNARGLTRLEKWLRVARLCFIGSPMMGLVAYFTV